METCACCGFDTIEEKGNYEICKICFWEDDGVQEADPWFERGANVPSLFQAQINYKKYGAMEERFIKDVRSPNQKDVKNPKWRPLTEQDKKHITTPAKIESVWGTAEAISYNYWERNG
jgi:hypothetical protein